MASNFHQLLARLFIERHSLDTPVMVLLYVFIRLFFKHSGKLVAAGVQRCMKLANFCNCFKFNGREDSLHRPRDTLYPLKLALTSPTSGGRTVGIVRWRTKAPEFVVCFVGAVSYFDLC
jgi:hypothetical protein